MMIMGLFRKSKKQVAKGGDQHMMSELALKSIRDGVIIIDANGDIQLINPAAETMTGYTKDEALGLNYASIIHLSTKEGQPVAENLNPVTQSIKTNTYSETRNLNLITHGSNKENAVSIIVTPTADSVASNKIITFRDIAKELKEEQERNEFISTASHEMRTPVASIEGYLGLAMNPQTATIDNRAADYLAKAHAASQHLGRLFRDLLDTTKLDDAKVKLHNEPVELTGFVQRIADQQSENIRAKGLAFQFGDGAFDERAGAKHKINQLVYVDVDLDALQEVVDNVIENAIKYTPSGKITVTVRGDGDKAQIVVQDTGIGIAREELSHIFQKFYRIDNSDTREIGGTGLGLYIAKRRVEAMGGKIWAESELGKGSRFIIVLPRISGEEYEKRRLVLNNAMAEAAQNNGFATAQNIATTPTPPIATTVQPLSGSSVVPNPTTVQTPIATAPIPTPVSTANPTVATPSQTSDSNQPPATAPTQAGSPVVADANGNNAPGLSPEELARIKAEFAQKIRSAQVK